VRFTVFTALAPDSAVTIHVPVALYCVPISGLQGIPEELKHGWIQYVCLLAVTAVAGAYEPARRAQALRDYS
jgi:hypothetical protein